MQHLLSSLGSPIEDPEEETFFLFSQMLASQDLGFVNPKATILEMTVAGKDLIVQQSPTLLHSDRDAGTTGAVVWKVTPLFADWISSDHMRDLQALIFSKESTILELGCGISGIVALTLAPKLARYIATDQEYVFKLLRQNLSTNAPKPKVTKTKVKEEPLSNINLIALDWESSIISSLPQLLSDVADPLPCKISAVIACDCIYNETLIEPFVRTCAELCQLKRSTETPTMCIIAQQLRSDIVFEAWLLAFHKIFNVWRVPEEHLEDLGFVIHIGILREANFC